MYGFVRQPKWILSHLLVLALVASMIGAGVWQLQRLSDRKATNELIEARADSEPARVSNMMATALEVHRNDDGSLGDVRYLPVELHGEFAGETIFIDNRSHEGAPGSWLATPFLLREAVEQDADENYVLVIRGFVGRAVVLNATPAELAPPTGQLVLRGLVQPGAGGGAFAQDREGLAAVSRPNVNAIADHFGIELDDVYVQLESPIEPTLTAVPRPEPNNGSHLSYAVQWFVFSLIGIVGYPLILRRRANAPSDMGDSSDDETRDDASSPSTLH